MKQVDRYRPITASTDNVNDRHGPRWSNVKLREGPGIQLALLAIVLFCIGSCLWLFLQHQNDLCVEWPCEFCGMFGEPSITLIRLLAVQEVAVARVNHWNTEFSNENTSLANKEWEKLFPRTSTPPL